jgi:hypothetical protein
MDIKDIKPGLYEHYKGGMYRVIGVAKHSETQEPMVVYQALYGEGGLWVRPAAMFIEYVEVVTPGGNPPCNLNSTPRFKRIERLDGYFAKPED